MKNKNEKGITIATLVVMIIIIIILVGTGLDISISSIQSSKYEVLKSELKMMQIKINSMAGENKEIGTDLTGENRETLNCKEVKEQLSSKVTETEETLDDIIDGFRLCTTEYIKQELGLDDITRNYLVNPDKCIVVSAEGLEVDGVTYYMLEQMDDGLYNVTYNNQISDGGTFTVTTASSEDGYTITITPEHEKYVSKWQVKYKLQDSTYWKTTNNLEFTVEKSGTYEIQVKHGDEIDLGTQTITIE